MVAKKQLSATMTTTRTTPETRAQRRREIVRATRAGYSQRAIAERLGISRALVQKELRAAREHNISLAPDPPERRATPAAIVRHTGTATYAGFSAILPPPDYLGQWKRLDLDRDTFSKVTPQQMISYLINVSPDASRAVWDWLRLLNAGHEILAFKPGTEDPDPRAQKALDEFIARLEEHHGTFKAIAGRLFMSAITRGAFFAELVLDQKGRIPLDIALPDPASVRFRLVNVPDRGEVWLPGQWQDGTFVIFDTPTVIYIALDPETDSPYGRPMIAPAVFPTVFLIGVLHDLRRVIAQQGYPRTDIIIRLEKLRAAYATLDDREFEEMVDQLIRTISREYATLEPDDTFVHTDPVELNRAGGAVDSSVMGGAAAIIESLERMATRALKTIPLLMGSVDGTGDANANRQWEIHAAGVRTVQHYAETLLSRLLGLALQAQGIVADVRVRFAEIRAAEELRDAQTFIAKLKGAELAERLGYVTADEAAEYVTAHGIPDELRDNRVPLINTSRGGGPEPTTATQLDGNEHTSETSDRARKKETTP